MYNKTFNNSSKDQWHNISSTSHKYIWWHITKPAADSNANWWQFEWLMWLLCSQAGHTVVYISHEQKDVSFRGSTQTRQGLEIPCDSGWSCYWFWHTGESNDKAFWRTLSWQQIIHMRRFEFADQSSLKVSLEIYNYSNMKKDYKTKVVYKIISQNYFQYQHQYLSCYLRFTIIEDILLWKRDASL